jgi:RNA polymerase subunit RPABC4/transcription elongation factor Spt4
MAPPAGIFGIHSHTASLAVAVVLALLAVIWLALVYYTWADARRRIADGVLVACATLTALFPFIGTLVYTIVRPPEYLEDVRERELEIEAAQARLERLGPRACPHCGHGAEREFLRCPHCLQKLKDACVNCRRPLEADWRICPYCETERELEPAATASRRQRRTRRDPQETMFYPPPPDLI